jgi:hypothetical protein
MTTSTSLPKDPPPNGYLEALLKAIPDPHDALVFAYAGLDVGKKYDDPGVPVIEDAIRALEAEIGLNPQTYSTFSSPYDARCIASNGLYVARKYFNPGAQVLEDAVGKLEAELALMPQTLSTSSSPKFIPLPRKLLEVWRNKQDKHFKQLRNQTSTSPKAKSSKLK